MANSGNSCQRWHGIRLMKEDIPCKKSCFDPSNGNCADYRIVEVVERDPSVVKPFLEPESPIRRQIDLRAECTRCFKTDKHPEINCTFAELQLDERGKNLCAAKCNTFGMAAKYKGLTKSPPSTPRHKQTIFFPDNTIIGRVFPMKFRLRRAKPNCNNCGRGVYLKETITDSSNIVLLSDCCSTEVYPEKKMDNWHRVTVGTITGEKKFSKKVLSEICKLEKKWVPEPEIIEIVKEIKKKAPKKGKKDKKKKNKKGKKK